MPDINLILILLYVINNYNVDGINKKNVVAKNKNAFTKKYICKINLDVTRGGGGVNLGVEGVKRNENCVT